VKVQPHAFLTSALDGGEWSASQPGRFTPRERVPGTHWIEGGVGPRAFWTRWWREKFLATFLNYSLLITTLSRIWTPSLLQVFEQGVTYKLSQEFIWTLYKARYKANVSWIFHHNCLSWLKFPWFLSVTKWQDRNLKWTTADPFPSYMHLKCHTQPPAIYHLTLHVPCSSEHMDIPRTGKMDCLCTGKWRSQETSPKHTSCYRVYNILTMWTFLNPQANHSSVH
jgi:hypothetical protein